MAGIYRVFPNLIICTHRWTNVLMPLFWKLRTRGLMDPQSILNVPDGTFWSDCGCAGSIKAIRLKTVLAAAWQQYCSEILQITNHYIGLPGISKCCAVSKWSVWNLSPCCSSCIWLSDGSIVASHQWQSWAIKPTKRTIMTRTHDDDGGHTSEKRHFFHCSG